jgi:hypothetical protein
VPEPLDNGIAQDTLQSTAVNRKLRHLVASLHATRLAPDLLPERLVWTRANCRGLIDVTLEAARMQHERQREPADTSAYNDDSWDNTVEQQ